MNLERQNRITVEPSKCGGRPCVRGLRIRVTDVLELLAALDYAAHQTDHVVLPTS